MSSTLNEFFVRHLPLLETELRDLLASVGPPYSDYYNMLHYHMGWLDDELRPRQGQAGKRVRPVLCLLACEAAGGAIEQALPAAAGIEILHNFSLLHDDIEDNSATRRGRPTVWKLWGRPQAINAGDGMFALAHLAFSHLTERGVPARRAFALRQVACALKQPLLDRRPSLAGKAILVGFIFWQLAFRRRQGRAGRGRLALHGYQEPRRGKQPQQDHSED